MTNSQSPVEMIVIAIMAFAFSPFQTRAAPQDFRALGVRRASDPDVRLKALLLVGVPEKSAEKPAHIPLARNATGPQVVIPDQNEPRYAALGSDETQQAIVVAQVAGTYAFAAVATPKANRWERIAVFDCWCKYDTPAVTDTFMALNRAPDPMRGDEIERDELVLRASGGGTGLYRQDEAHFRLYRGEMKAVMSFVSRVQRNAGGAPPPWHLDIERRWFYPSLPVSNPDRSSVTVAVLVTCRTFRWNQDRFQYEPVSAPNACKSPGQ